MELWKDKVLRLRKKMGMTQAQFAKVIGVTPTSIHRYERGKTIPDDRAKRDIDRIDIPMQIFRKSKQAEPENTGDEL